MKIIKHYRSNFSEIIKAVDLSEDHMNMDMISEFAMGAKSDPILGLCNPYSKISKTILYLYSMELGTP